MLSTDPHDEFRELCALSASGELTAEEWRRLTDHLANCAECRELKEQFESITRDALASLAGETYGDGEPDADENVAMGSWSIQEAEAKLMTFLDETPAPDRRNPIPVKKPTRPTLVLRYAAVAVILLVSGVSGYRMGVLRGHSTNVAPNVPPKSTLGSAVSPGKPQSRSGADRDQAAMLHEKLRQSQRELASIRKELNQAKSDLADRNADLDRIAQERTALTHQLREAQANAEGAEAKLREIHGQSTTDAAQTFALKSQVQDLTAALEDKDQEIAHQDELLQHDRDIRDLVSARGLYIAEIYDVAKNGDTQKPFGRVFYTKDKSLIFYGYDLDNQKGLKKDAVFQVWGRERPDQSHDVSLGLLYQDDANQKRWVLKFNDKKTISQLNAVFITVEPAGGSTKPSGKPLLFTYLRIDPNHP